MPHGGVPLTGRLIRLSSDQIEFESGQQAFTFGRQQVDQLNFESPSFDSPSNLTIELVDGSLLNAVSFVSHDRKSQIELASIGSIEIENRNIHSICFNTKLDAAQQQQWSNIQRIGNPDITADALVVNRNAELNLVEGLIGEITRHSVNFSIDERTADVSREKLFGLLFYHAAGRRLDSPVAIVHLVDGSTFQTRELLVKQDVLQISTTSGVDARLELSAISRIEFGVLRSVFLSDLPPTTSQWQPVFESPVARSVKPLKLPRINSGFENRPLQLCFYRDVADPFLCEIRDYEKGLAMSGGSRMAFALEGKYAKLTGWVGFDPQANANGLVQLSIHGDGKTLLQQQMQNSDNSNPIEIDLDIPEIQRLVITVDYADGRGIGDILNLCDMKLTK